MSFNNVLILGSGQIGKEVARRLLEKEPDLLIIHNLRKEETDSCVENFEKIFKNTKFVKSYGDAFMPYNLNKLYSIEEKLKHQNELIDFFYSNLDEEILKQSTLYQLSLKYRPDIIVDTMNSGTVLGSHFNPDEIKRELSKSNISKDIFVKHLLYDYTQKAVNFVLSIKLAMEEFNIKKFIKVSTTGLGGMGMNMSYTHGDTPKSALSYALMGKISASGTLHHLLWRLANNANLDVSLIVPSTYVGYDSAKFEPIETDIGLIKKFEKFENKTLAVGEKLSYASGEERKEYLEFPVVRAGENHVYSLYELNTLTAIGQMEAITKEEVADAVIEDLFGGRRKNMLYEMDKASLGPTYAGHAMAEKSKNEIKELMQKHNVTSIATGNLGATSAKSLYELYLIKCVCKTVSELKNCGFELVHKSIGEYLDKNSSIIVEMVSLGLPVVKKNKEIYIGKYSLYPSVEDDLTITEEKLENWISTAWVDLRQSNIDRWCNFIINAYEDAKKFSAYKTFKLNRNINAIRDDYDIGEILAYYLNMEESGRKRLNV